MVKIIKMSDVSAAHHGRCVYSENGELTFCWTLSGFSTRFRAERVIVHFGKFSDDQPTYLQLTVDGRKNKYALATGEEKILIEDLGQGEHTMKLVKLSEGAEPVRVAALELVGEDCEILEAPKLPDLRIEFFGDSITCGFGTIAEPDVDAHNYWEEDSSKAYAGLTGEALGADYRVNSMSGQGIVKNHAGAVGTLIPMFFEWDSRKGKEPHDFKSWVPHIVVVNAGTNDNSGGVPAGEFGEGVEKFLDRIREVYPDAYIFWAYGMMGMAYDATLTKIFEKRGQTDGKMWYVPIRPIHEFEGETGPWGHPNYKGNIRAAKQLTQAIREKVGL